MAGTQRSRKHMNVFLDWPAPLLWFALMLVAGCSLGAETQGQLSEIGAAGGGAPAQNGLFAGHMQYGGRERSFALYIPRGYDGKAALPLLVALHGGLGTGTIFEAQAQLRPHAERLGYFVVYPDGVGRTWNAGSCCGKAAREHVDDVGFIAALVHKLERAYRIDSDRIYATGFSNGAMMVHRIACERPRLFTAIAPVAGSIMGDHCNPDAPTPALLVRGRADERIPWDGGSLRGTYRKSMEEMVSKLGARNGCSAARKLTFSRGDAHCWTLQGCPEAPVRYCGIKGLGHQWAGGKSVLSFMLGGNTEDFDASAQIFRFFEAVGAGG